MPRVRIDDIIQRIRREIAAESEGGASERSAPVDDHLPPISARPELEHLNRNWRLFDADPELRSHRRLIGPLVVRMKKAVRRIVFSGLDKEKLFLSELVRFQNALALRSDRLLREVTERTKAVAERNDLFLGAFDVRLEALEARERMRHANAGAPVASADAAEDEAVLAEMAAALGGRPSERVRPFVERLRSASRVVVLGSGDGEILDALGGLRVEAVEASAALVAECRSRGLDVTLASLRAHLESLPEASIGAVIVTRIADRHPIVWWPRLVALAWRSLEPGGIAVFEGLTDERAAARIRWLCARQRFAIVDDRACPAAAGAGERVIAGERRDLG